MDEAIHRLQQAPASDQLRASMARATRVVAQQAAVKEVKRQLQRVARLLTSLIARSWRWPRTTRSPRFSADPRTSNTPSEALADAVQGLLVGVKSNELFQ